MPQWVLVIIAVVVIAIAGAIVSSQNGDDGDGDTTQTTNCPTKCVVLGEFECNSGRYLGWCIGWWSCPSSVPNGCDD